MYLRRFISTFISLNKEIKSKVTQDVFWPFTLGGGPTFMQKILFPDSRFVAQREYYGSDMALFLVIHVSVWSSLGFPSGLGLECWVT